MYSDLFINKNIIVNDVEKYDKNEYQVLDYEKTGKLEDSFEKLVEFSITNSGSFQLSPFSFNWPDHKQIYSILKIFREFTNTLALSSCRLDAIARDPYLVKIIDYFGSTNITIAIEGISQRIRNFFQKSLTNEDIYLGIYHTLQQNFNEVKFYFIYTGYEEEEDIREFALFLDTVDELRKFVGKENQIVRISFTPLLPTLGTASQYHGSRVGRSMKNDFGILWKLRQLVKRHGFGLRVSTSISVNDLSLFIEMTDRRSSPLISYASLNGLFNFPKMAITFYEGEKEISKKEYKKIPSSNRMQMNGKFYQVEFLDRINLHKLYKNRNEMQLYEDYSIFDLIKAIDECDGKLISDELLESFPEVRQKYLKGKKVFVMRYNPEELIYTYKNGKKVFFLKPINFTEISMDLLKKYLSIFTNGQTWNDLCYPKDSFYIFPNMHIKYHLNQHMAQNYKQYMENRNALFNSYCVKDMLSRCIKCGSCKTIEEVKHITVDSCHEKGVNHFDDLAKSRKDFNIAQKLIVEVEVDPGPSSAISEKWFRYAINSVLLKCDKSLVKCLIGERVASSRQIYKIRFDNFKSFLAGKYLQEISFNNVLKLDKDYIEFLKSRVNKFVTKGWKISDIKCVPPEYTLKSNVDYSLIKYVFDNRKVNITLPSLKKNINKFLDDNHIMKYKAKRVATRFSTRSELIDFDKSQVLNIVAGPGEDRYKTVMNVFMTVKDNHPLIFISGFLNQSMASLYGTDILIEGHYHKPQVDFSIFDAMEVDSKLSVSCPRCGGPKFINVMSESPFGILDYEKIEGYEGICQFCFSELGG